MAKRLLDEDLRQANKSTSPLKTQAFKLANGTRYKSTAADGEMGKFAGNNPAYPAGYMNVNPMLAPVQNGFAGMRTGAGAVSTVNMPAVIPPMNTFLPSGFVPVSLNGFQQPQPRPQNVINQPGFNPQMQVISPTASTMPPVMVNQPQRPTARTTPAPFQTPPTNGFLAAGASSYPATSYMAPNQQGNTTQKPPSNEITSENYSQWVDYWNWQARNPQAARAQAQAQAAAQGKPDPFAPYVMTRDQIWQMKANQRRKQMEKNAEGNPYAPAGMVSYAPNPYTGTGEFYSTILNTGSG